MENSHPEKAKRCRDGFDGVSFKENIQFGKFGKMERFPQEKKIRWKIRCRRLYFIFCPNVVQYTQH